MTDESFFSEENHWFLLIVCTQLEIFRVNLHECFDNDLSDEIDVEEFNCKECFGNKVAVFS